MTLRDQTRHAYQQGWYAGQDGLPLDDNPHPVNTVERDAWREGWFAGRRSMQ